MGNPGSLPAAAQAAPSAPAPAPSKDSATHGTVLFERHTSAADPQPPDTTTDPADPAAAGKAPSSSIRRRSSGRGLQRRDADAAQSPSTLGTSGSPSQGLVETQAEKSAAVAACTSPCDPTTTDVTDAERDATRLLDTALDLHLNLQTGATAARAKLLVRNGAPTPVTRLTLQLSSSLQWQSARLMLPAQPAGIALAVHQHRIVTDTDHTGAATELVLVLPQPLAPEATVSLDLFYGGTLGSSAERLARLGAPAGRAALSDWDVVSDQFTGLRGFGNVLWAPTSAPIALLATPDRFSNAVDEQRRRNLRAKLGLRLTLETNGTNPGTAFLLGMPRALAGVALESSSPTADAPATGNITRDAKASTAPSNMSSSSSSQEESQPPNPDDDETGQDSRLYTSEWPATAIGDSLPALFVTAAPEQQGALWVRVWTADAATADAVQTAANRVRPLLEDWLGARPARALEVLNLPLPDALPYAADGMLVAPLAVEDPKGLASALVYPMAQAWLPTGTQSAWLAEGLPAFLQALYLERTAGHEAVVAGLRSSNQLLAKAEVDRDTPDRPTLALAECVDALCARIKGAAVFAMLRQLVGDAALKQAIAAWVAAPPLTEPAPASPAYSSSTAASPFATGASARFEQLLQKASGKDLGWFFADWIDRDAGLPDLTIVSVAPRRIERGTVTNTVPSVRRPVGGPIGAEPVPQPGDPTQQESATAASRNRIAPREGSWLIAVEVQNNGGAPAEVPVTVRGGGLQNSLPLRVPAHGRSTIRVPFETAPEEVTVNDGTTPESRTTTHRRTINLPDTQ